VSSAAVKSVHGKVSKWGGLVFDDIGASLDIYKVLYFLQNKIEE
jgi:hypothetical protein